MGSKYIPFLFCVILLSTTLLAEEIIQIDAQPDSIYRTLNGPDEGYLVLSNTDFLPYSGPKPGSDNDLSAKVWMVWDDHYLYVYAEIMDDIISSKEVELFKESYI